jgi:hypothetical protein
MLFLGTSSGEEQASVTNEICVNLRREKMEINYAMVLWESLKIKLVLPKTYKEAWKE